MWFWKMINPSSVHLNRVQEHMSVVCQVQFLPPQLGAASEILPPLHYFLLDLLKAELQVRRADVQDGVDGIQLFLQLQHNNLKDRCVKEPL